MSSFHEVRILCTPTKPTIGEVLSSAALIAESFFNLGEI